MMGSEKLNLSFVARPFYLVLATGLTILSALCTAYFLMDMAPPGMIGGGEGAFIAGLFLEAGKFALVPLALVLMTVPGKRAMGFVLGLLGAVLFTVSVLSSYFFMERSIEPQRAEVVSSSAEAQGNRESIKLLDAQIAQLDESIAQNKANAKQYAEMDYLTRSNETLEQGKPLLKERTALIEKRNDLVKASASITENNDSFLFSAKLEALQWVVALLIDLVPIAFMTLLQMDRRERMAEQRLKALMERGSVKAKPEAPVLPETPEKRIEGGLSLVKDEDRKEPVVTEAPAEESLNVDPEDFQVVVDSLLAGKVEPKVRDVARLIGKRNNVASDCLKLAGQKGILEKQGQGWRMAG